MGLRWLTGAFCGLGAFRVQAPKILLWVAYLEILLNDSFSYVFWYNFCHIEYLLYFL